MITSTLSLYQGKKIVKQLGIVTAFDDAWRPLRMNVELDVYIDYAIEQLSKKAGNLGANGVLGISFALMEKTKPLVIGTAVLLDDE